jgi:hypothetical protein
LPPPTRNDLATIAEEPTMMTLDLRAKKILRHQQNI